MLRDVQAQGALSLPFSTSATAALATFRAEMLKAGWTRGPISPNSAPAPTAQLVLKDVWIDLEPEQTLSCVLVRLTVKYG
jgi:hypothetical protein